MFIGYVMAEKCIGCYTNWNNSNRPFKIYSINNELDGTEYSANESGLHNMQIDEIDNAYGDPPIWVAQSMMHCFLK